jgi:hypothetical protein
MQKTNTSAGSIGAGGSGNAGASNNQNSSSGGASGLGATGSSVKLTGGSSSASQMQTLAGGQPNQQ